MKKKLILCVDDEKVVLNSLKEQLKPQVPQGYRVDIAESAQEALEVIEEYEAEGYEILLVISDYVMPGMQGDEFLEKVHVQHPESVKILLTGQATLEGMSHIINKAGLFRYIQKPWQKEDMVLATLEAIKSFEKDRKIEVQNERLVEQNQNLEKWANSVVETLSKSLDSRDTTTFGHSNRMATYATSIAKCIHESCDPYFENDEFSASDYEVLRISALLHDVGKIGIRENILLKKTRLTEEHMDLIHQRWLFIVTHIEAKSDHLRTDLELFFHQNHILFFQRLESINQANRLEKEDLKFIEELHGMEFEGIYHFNGQNIRAISYREFQSLNVPYGNLTPSEREVIKTHAELTHDILNNIPWPEELKAIPEIASSHHERLDGSGYYRGLSGDEIHIFTKILSILDVYEALTSKDRPYRGPESTDGAFDILFAEAKAGRMDGEIIQLLKNIVAAEQECKGANHEKQN